MSLIGDYGHFDVSGLWFEDAWAEFFHWGPPEGRVGQPRVVGVLVAFIVGLITFQAVHVYIEETFGRPFERQHIQEKKWTRADVTAVCLQLLQVVMYNIVYFGGNYAPRYMVSYRIVDTATRMLIWSPQNGRYPRTFAL